MKIGVLIKEPGKNPRHVNISDTLSNLQSFVGGYIETFRITSDMTIICNEEGRLLNLPYNCELCGESFVGTIIICGLNGDEFADLPCDFDTIKKLLPRLWN